MVGSVIRYRANAAIPKGNEKWNAVAVPKTVALS